MTPKEMKELAELLQKVPGIKSIEIQISPRPSPPARRASVSSAEVPMFSSVISASMIWPNPKPPSQNQAVTWCYSTP